MNQHDPDADRFSPHDNLPEVRPPSAGFIFQLFVIPGVVVLLIILVWLLFSWLAHMGGNPASYVAEMKKNRANSWQQANNLAEELTHNEASRSDRALAKEVADFLNELLDQPLPPPEPHEEHKGNPRDEEIERRYFLCKALGEFRVADAALPVLLRAAAPHHNQDELKIRLAALQAIAELADNVKKTEPLSNPRLLPTLLLATRDDEHIVAVTGTYALGVLGGKEAIARLKQILREDHPAEVHYNAALGLARNDSAAGLSVIREMIDPNSTRGLIGEEPQNRDAKREWLQLNGLHAVRQLSGHIPDKELPALLDALNRIGASNASPVVKSQAVIARKELIQAEDSAK